MDITIIITKLTEEMKKIFAAKEDVPTKTSDLINDNDFATTANIPTKTSDLINDNDFATTTSIPTKTSDLVNDVGFLIEHQDITNKENISNKTTSLSSSNTDTQYPSAKATYNALNTKANINHTHENISDSGWQNVVFKSGFSNYSSTNPMRYRRIGKIVHLEGIIKNTSAFTPNTGTTIVATIDDPYCRPTYSQYTLMQGTGANRFLLIINSDGTIGISRYGTTTTSTQVEANSWLHTNASWMIENENISYPTLITEYTRNITDNGFLYTIQLKNSNNNQTIIICSVCCC